MVFPTIVDSLAVEVMSVEVFRRLWLKKTSRYPSEVEQVPKHWPAALIYKFINHEGRGLCSFVHVKFN